MASPQMVFSPHIILNFFRRNNPLEAMVMGFVQFAYNLVTFQSRRKLLKYRKMLEFQKLERIEKTLNDFNPYAHHKGVKMDRTY